jgi:RimJ/RimL family protein N-acetyltransferase
MPLSDPPRLLTERLVLEGHTADDFEPLAAAWADPEVVRHISGKPSSRGDSWSRLLSYRGLWPVLGYGYWAVRERASGRYVGDVGFADFHRELEPPIRGWPEAGWVLASWAHGRGYATEALTAACRWLDGSQPCAVCILASQNVASIRVAEKAGFTEEQPAIFRGEPCLLRTRHRPPLQPQP